MPGLPKKYIKKYGISKAAWNAYRRAKGSRRASPKGGRKTPTRRRRYARKARRAARRARDPLISHMMFSGGAYGGEVLTDNYMRPWMSKSPFIGNNQLAQGIALLGTSFLIRKFTRGKRGLQTVGDGAAAYPAAKGFGMLVNTLKGSLGGR